VEIGKPLWEISKGDRTWKVSEFDVPRMTFVVGHTGIKAPTGPLVEKVRRYKEHSRFASDIIDEIGLITLQGMNAIRRTDKEDLGDIMTRDHKLLSILGVSCNELNKLVNASLPYSYGAKLTGSGGGGSMIALTDEPEKVCEAISLRGGKPIVVSTGEEGVRIEKGMPQILSGL
ncbi:MAG: mevalonate kinase, partial [Candidatus Methanomethylophilaceae archaeon]|nr:mevalonate kinase [Candidatus Methanomethylophilaceae archaeon]